MKTKLDHIYGTAGAVDALETKVSNLETKVTNLGNITAKTNLSNTFTGNQTISGSLLTNNIYTSGNEQTLVNIVNQGEKKIYVNFEQPKAGFRNYSHLILRHKIASGDYVELLKITAQSVDQGIFLTATDNLVTFPIKTTMKNVVIKELKDIIAASTDFNDFKNKIRNW